MTARVLASLILTAILLVGTAEGAEAQVFPVRSLAPGKLKTPSNDDIPASHRPPPGLCRVWLDNVPPAQQPAPTDCSSAIKNRPSNGRVVYPDDVPRTKRGERGDGNNEKDDKRGRDEKSRDERKGKPRKPPEPTE